jgi:hypothetical protein
MSADKSVTANFTLIEYTLTVSVAGSGSVTKSPNKPSYHYSDVVQLTAVPAVSWYFSAWSGDLTGSENPKNITINGNKSVTANFTQVMHNLTIAVAPAGGGTTTPSAGAVHSYAEGTVVPVTAAPAAGYVFSSWSGACTGSGACNVTMNTDKSVTANFIPAHNLTVAVAPAGGGTTTPSAGVHSYAEGTVVPVTAAAAAGYIFDHWSDACTGSGSCSVTMSADKTVTANFTALIFLPMVIR